MVFSKTASDILRNPWFMEPKIALSYVEIINNILTKNRSDFDERIAAVAIRQRIASDGTIVSKEEDTPEGSIGIVSIMGPMIKYGDWCSWGADELVGFAKEFEADENIIGQIWLMDSGGGSVSAIAPYLDFIKTKTKPVVSLADMSASANYYVASSTDYIMAENNISSMFGSIGVMLEFADYKQYYEEKGIKLHSVYADQSTHKNLAFQKALEGDYEPIRTELLNPLAVKFQEHIKSQRKHLDTNVEGILNGKMFFAEDALKYGLIDGIGNLEAAIEKVRFLASARSFISTHL